MENLKNLLSFGNKKLPATTAIFNSGSATNCPSKELGLCALCKECYAMKAERQYPAALPYRERQKVYWQAVTAEQFVTEFLAANSRKRVKANALRFNEAGDFHNQAELEKADKIAELLGAEGIRVYAYTARRDLDTNKCKALNIMGSFITAEQKHSAFIGIKDAKKAAKQMRGFYRKTAVCPGDCKKCSLCQVAKGVVVFAEIH